MNKTFSFSRLFITCCAFAVALLMAPVAFAQVGDQPAAPEPVEITDELLDSVAEAYVDVQLINERYEALFAQAESAEEASQIQGQAMTEITGAIEEQGLTIQQYEGVIMQVQVDEGLRGDLVERINAVVQERGLGQQE